MAKQFFNAGVNNFLVSIDGQVRLGRLQTDNSRLFLRKQTDKRQNFCMYDEQTVKEIEENCLGFRFLFENGSIYI